MVVIWGEDVYHREVRFGILAGPSMKPDAHAAADCHLCRRTGPEASGDYWQPVPEDAGTANRAPLPIGDQCERVARI